MFMFTVDRWLRKRKCDFSENSIVVAVLLLTLFTILQNGQNEQNDMRAYTY